MEVVEQHLEELGAQVGLGEQLGAWVLVELEVVVVELGLQTCIVVLVVPVHTPVNSVHICAVEIPHCNHCYLAAAVVHKSVVAAVVHISALGAVHRPVVEGVVHKSVAEPAVHRPGAAIVVHRSVAAGVVHILADLSLADHKFVVVAAVHKSVVEVSHCNHC